MSRVAGPSGPGGDAASGEPSASAEGRFVAFASAADNLSDQDSDAVADVFRRDVSGVASPSRSPAPVAGRGPGLRAAATARVRTGRCAGRPATIVGTGAGEEIRGTGRRDVIAAGGGSDVVRGLGGVNLICLGPGTDFGHGGGGDDLIRGGPGRDLLVGGAGADLLIGAGGRDTALGGSGLDLCRVEVRGPC